MQSPQLTKIPDFNRLETTGKPKKDKYQTKEELPVHMLYLTEDHVLGAELCELMQIHTANISNLKLPSILKFGNCPILCKSDSHLPPKIKINLFRSDLTSLKDKIPLSYFKAEYNLTTEEILEHVADRIEVIAGRKILCYKPEFLQKIKRYKIDNMIYIADRKELNEFLYEYEDIDYITVSKNKYIVIY